MLDESPRHTRGRLSQQKSYAETQKFRWPSRPNSANLRTIILSVALRGRRASTRRSLLSNLQPAGHSSAGFSLSLRRAIGVDL
jgi:hypothetical protein